MLIKCDENLYLNEIGGNEQLIRNQSTWTNVLTLGSRNRAAGGKAEEKGVGGEVRGPRKRKPGSI